jgi:type I restriction enzyme S subunit
MEQVMNKIDLNNLDKSTWDSYTFEEIVFRISETVDPNKTDLAVYVGLEHIDAEDIHIRRKGTPDDVNGQKLKCYPGDIIFGKRRAYQRKAAIVDFEGICSAHAFVLRANPTVIDPQLFPFFLHSDQFMHRMVDISVGGLSPTINWGDLKHQEFLLPPKDQQAQLSELLWAMDEVIEREMEVLENLEVQKHTLFNELHKLRYNSFVFLKDLCITISSGGTPSRLRESEFFGGEINWVKTKELNDWIVIETEESLTKIGLKNSSAKLYPSNTILLAMYGVTVGKIGIIKTEMACNQACCALIVDENKIDNWFLFYYLIALRKRLIDLSVGSAQPNISSGIIKNLKIPNIPKNEQIFYSNKLKNLDEAKFTMSSKIASSKALKKSLINQVF